MSDSFVHLHVHSEYSMLDGAAKLKPLFAEAERLGMPAVGVTDHGNMYGAYEFWQMGKKTGIKPILGIEAYLAPHDRFHKKPVYWGGRKSDDDISGNGAYTHMTMLAENATGLRNLFRLSSLASIEGYYYKPRMDRELVAQYAQGIIATTGCPSGEVQTRLRLGQEDEALKAASDYRDIFGPENFFLELMDHGLQIERRVRKGLLEIGRKLNLAPLATNDSHYVTQDQATMHEALLCIQSGSTLMDPNRFKFDGDGYYLKSPAEMRQLWEDVPGACDSSLLIAERVQPYDEVFTYVDRMPAFPIPEGETQSSWLRKETARKVAEIYGDNPSEEVRQRVAFELDVIDNMGFPAYFLVVADICDYARRNGIRVGPGRGSATGSIVAYVMGITRLDPLEHALLFERFLNPERITPPDVDLDFDERRRGEMIRYVTEKYGDDKVCQILTFGTIKAKAAIKDAARVLGYPFAVGDRITKALPPDVMGKGIPITGIFDSGHERYGEAAEVRGLYETDPDVKKVIDTARGLEGLTRGTGVHAAGVILSSDPLLDLLPVHRRDADGAIITGFPFPQCEEMGLLKMDFLGLRNLTVIDDAVKNIKENRGIDVDVEALPLEDKLTYELLARGDTLGVFQLDSGPIRNLLKLMAPTKFGDIAAVLALYRPGPMAANSHIEYADRKNNRKPADPIHPELGEVLEPILGETYHLVVYQEQVMAIAQKLAGYTLGGADLLRRAMGKKKKEVLDAEYAKFTGGMIERGYSKEAAQAVWDVLVPFSGYGFNKSHTAGYGIVSFWTAYLKANYPVEYMAALLTSVGDNKDQMATYLAETRKMGVKVLSPDVNESGLRFAAVGGDIRFGLGAVRNVGAAVVELIVGTRKEKGAYTSFDDFLSKSELPVCNKRVIQSLAESGAFDSLGHTRRAIVSCHEDAIDAVTGLKRKEAIGQFDLFGSIAEADAPTVGLNLKLDEPEWDRKTLLQRERDMLGLYVSGHPLDGTEAILNRNRDTSILDLIEGSRTEGEIQLAGIISKVERRMSKKDGSLWASIALEDFDASIDVMFFAKVYPLVSEALIEDTVVMIKGRLNERDGALTVFGSDVAVLDVGNAASGAAAPIVLNVRSDRVTPEFAQELRATFDRSPGERPVHLRMQTHGQHSLWSLGVRVDATPSLMADLKTMFGPGSVVM
ncbi:DNA polymerase III subunit alpha [Catellatospora sp. NPDC049133]|uniref:DNA polymerase III subunit alpha n=1 Tax=Catellatospora sp. NPDC049133 TaxID=3155499 RepID=UPI0033DB5C39